MAKHSSDSKPSLNDLSRQLPTKPQFATLMHELDRMDGRAAVLILSALLDNTLEQAIRARFISLSNRRLEALFWRAGAPLSSFSAKTAVAYAMGIIGDELRAQLDRIRSIRNAFAHAMLSISFEDELIAAECRKLDPQKLTNRKYKPESDSPRERFIAAGQLAASILMRDITHTVTERRYGPDPWRRPSNDKF
jgi:hypothetical protein